MSYSAIVGNLVSRLIKFNYAMSNRMKRINIGIVNVFLGSTVPGDNLIRLALLISVRSFVIKVF